MENKNSGLIDAVKTTNIKVYVVATAFEEILRTTFIKIMVESLVKH